MSLIRPAAVAGLFYPDDAAVLASTVAHLMGDVRREAVPSPPKALIVPHAGYVYSGAVAASAYATVEAARGTIERVVLIGPSHRVPFRGLALTRAEAFSTPLGDVPVDVETAERIFAMPQVIVLDEAHAREHSLEVHLPFLITVLGRFRLLPLVVGDADADEVAEVLEAVWGGPETLIVVSSDLSHYLDYDTARRVDGATTRAIEARHDDLGPEQACGCRAINGLMRVARRRDMAVQVLDVRNSGDTAGDRSRVVGYGAYAIP
ncbi:MAG: AmmeMemoRadiSam system protein B [Gammaproteobacteria bacterium]|nr:AmmeMemoRadiSam system protein B [Gammaproteobacteria bacterium]